jgi:hypothetical protein
MVSATQRYVEFFLCNDVFESYSQSELKRQNICASSFYIIYLTRWTYTHFFCVLALGGPKLLERNTKKQASIVDDEDNDSVEGGADDGDNKGDPTYASTPSFRSDRRIVRLLIARCFADTLQEAYLKELE